MRISITQLKACKGKEKITALTVYDYNSAQILDGEIDVMLVGDSLGMVLYGMDSTLPVTLDIMARHAAAVVKGSQQSFIVADMPFGTYQKSPAQAFKNAAYLMAETGVQAVKIEGGAEMARTVKFITQRGIPVMGHIGLQPQSYNSYGGFKIQGKDEKSADSILQSAKKLEAAGCFAIVIEGVPENLAAKITREINIPTIGIGASAECDGQVLVSHDMLGLTSTAPKFVKKFAEFGKELKAAAAAYSQQVKSQEFPGKDHTY